MNDEIIVGRVLRTLAWQAEHIKRTIGSCRNSGCFHLGEMSDRVGAGLIVRVVQSLTQIRRRSQEFHQNHECTAIADHGEFYHVADALLRDDTHKRVFAGHRLAIN